MKELKEFIDNLPSDKKSHVVLGLFLNPPTIIGSTKVANMVLDNLYISLALSLIPCILIHWGIEYWQRKTGKGQYDLLDAVAGVSTSVVIVICCIITLLMKVS